MDAEILQKEKSSVKSPYFHINNLDQEGGGSGSEILDTDTNVYRLYKMNRLMNHLHITQAVPYMFKSFTVLDGFAYDDLRNKYTKIADTVGQYFKLRLDSQKKQHEKQMHKMMHSSVANEGAGQPPKEAAFFTLYHSALYKVEYMKFRPLENHSGS